MLGEGLASTVACPQCGGTIEARGAAEAKCSHCGHIFVPGEDTWEFPAKSHAATETTVAKDVSDFMERAPWKVPSEAHAVSYTCPACGARLVADEAAITARCPYCSNNLVVSGPVSATELPGYVVPFSVDEQKAKKAIQEHLKKLSYAPKGLFEKIDRLYPIYSFRAECHA